MLPHRSLQKAEAASNLFQGSATIKQVPKPRRLGLEREGAGRGLGPQQARWEQERPRSGGQDDPVHWQPIISDGR